MLHFPPSGEHLPTNWPSNPPIPPSVDLEKIQPMVARSIPSEPKTTLPLTSRCTTPETMTTRVARFFQSWFAKPLLPPIEIQRIEHAIRLLNQDNNTSSLKMAEELSAILPLALNTQEKLTTTQVMLEYLETQHSTIMKKEKIVFNYKHTDFADSFKPPIKDPLITIYPLVVKDTQEVLYVSYFTNEKAAFFYDPLGRSITDLREIQLVSQTTVGAFLLTLHSPLKTLPHPGCDQKDNHTGPILGTTCIQRLLSQMATNDHDINSLAKKFLDPILPQEMETMRKGVLQAIIQKNTSPLFHQVTESFPVLFDR